MAEKATGAFVLSLIGAIFHLIGGLVVIFFSALFVGFSILDPSIIFGAAFAGLAIAFAVIFIILAFLGALWINSGEKTRTTYGGVLTLIISIVAFATFWGLAIGSLLGFIGAILALVWNPTPPMPAPAPAPAAMPPPATPTPEPAPEPAPEPEESSGESSTESEET